MIRDEKWLFLKLDEVWDKHFSDVPQNNTVKIVWGRRAKCRLGSIKKGQKIGKNFETVITINALFKDENIPEYVVTGTIAHELAHYTHGFNSPLERKFRNPHEGGVEHKELKDRGLEKVLKAQKRWLKENWQKYVEGKLPNSVNRRRIKRKVIIKWI
jgi:hypothetical protein